MDHVEKACGLFQLNSDETEAALNMADELIDSFGENSLGISAAVCYYASKHRKPNLLPVDFAEKLGISKELMMNVLIKIPNRLIDYPENAFSPLHQIDNIMGKPFESLMEMFSKSAEMYNIGHLVARKMTKNIRPKMSSILQVITDYGFNTGRNSRPIAGAVLLLITYGSMVQLLEESKTRKYKSNGNKRISKFVSWRDYAQTVQCSHFTLRNRFNEITALLAEYARDIIWLQDKVIDSDNVFRYLDDIVDFSQVRGPDKDPILPTSSKAIPAFARSESGRRTRTEQIDEAFRCIRGEVEQDKIEPEVGLILILLRAGHTQESLQTMSDKNIRHYVDDVLIKQEGQDKSDTLLEC
ncbi:hypothetical protein CLU79DRAFT_840963 [Phycomyces nitens]|nr:hypothetical protein CLU79DRAFT_840963 [Phycomyces nitens]